MDYSLYSLQSKEQLKQLADAVRAIAGTSSEYSLIDIKTFLENLDATYVYEQESIPTTEQISITISDAALIPKTDLESVADLIRARCINSTTDKLTVSQMGKIITAFVKSEEGTGVYDIYTVVFASTDYYSIFKQVVFYSKDENDEEQEIGNLTSENATFGEVIIENLKVEDFSHNTIYDYYPNTYFVVKYTITVPDDGNVYLAKINYDIEYSEENVFATIMELTAREQIQKNIECEFPSVVRQKEWYNFDVNIKDVSDIEYLKICSNSLNEEIWSGIGSIGKTYYTYNAYLWPYSTHRACSIENIQSGYVDGEDKLSYKFGCVAYDGENLNSWEVIPVNYSGEELTDKKITFYSDGTRIPKSDTIEIPEDWEAIEVIREYDGLGEYSTQLLKLEVNAVFTNSNEISYTNGLKISELFSDDPEHHCIISNISRESRGGSDEYGMPQSVEKNVLRFTLYHPPGQEVDHPNWMVTPYISSWDYNGGYEGTISTATTQIWANGQLYPENDDGIIEEDTNYATSAIYASGYAGYLPQDVTIKLYEQGVYVGETTVYYDYDEQGSQIRINTPQGFLSGMFKVKCTGYYSEHGNESYYEYYLAATLHGPTSAVGYGYTINLSCGYFNEDIFISLGDDMPYIPEPEYKGDLSPTREYHFTGSVNMDYWASDDIYLSIKTPYGAVYTTSTQVDAEGYYEFSGFEIYFAANYVYTDEFGELVRIMEGTISSKNTINSIIVHNTPSLSTSDKLHYLDFTE